jgi:hemerythrin superfamily protein
MPAKTKSTRTARRASSSRRANALSILTADHERVMQLFERFEKAQRDEQKVRLASEICSELTAHAQLEEEIFYPAVREAIGEEDLMDEAEVEHASAKELIAQIESGSVKDDRWEAKVTVLGEYIRHHVKEEQGEMFKKVRASELDLEALGEQLQARKGKLASKQAAPGERLAGLVRRALR